MLTMLESKSSRNWLRLIDDIMSFIIRKIMRYSMYVFYIVVKPYSMYFCNKIPNKKLPPIKNELLRIPGVKLAEMIRNQNVKCEDVIKAYINRCLEVNPVLNAIVEDRFDDALEEAREIDRQIQSGFKTIDDMKKETPLLGLPLTVKESIQVQGLSNTAGRCYKKKQIAKEDAPIVKNARKHGAVILCVTNTPELCLCWETYNKNSGTTKNPYDVRRTPGGSSGGEAALIGAGASLFGLGSDVAGSIRLPAMFVGIYGHKPSPYVCCPYGHNPQSDDKRWPDYFTTGPLARYAEDLPLLLNAVREQSGPSLQLFKEIDVKKIRFHFMTDDHSGMTRNISPCIRESLFKVANHFNAREANIPLMIWGFDICMSTMMPMPFDTIYTKTEEGQKPKTEAMEILRYVTGRSQSTLTSVLISTFQFVTKNIPKARKRKLEKIKEKLSEEMLKLLGDDGVLLYPTFPTSANNHFEIFHKLMDPSFLMVFNALGLPVTQVHTGFDKHKLPIGLQVVASPGNDHITLAIANEIQKIFGGWIPADEVEAKLSNN